MFLVYDQSKNFFSKHTSSLIVQYEKDYLTLNSDHFFDKIYLSFNQKEVIINFQNKSDIFKYPFNLNDLKKKFFINF